MPPDGELEICDADGRETGVTIESFAVPGKVALYLEDPEPARRPTSAPTSGDTIGVRIAGGNGGGAAFYIPGCARVDADLRSRLDGAACLLFDGTVYTDDEMIAAGVGEKTGARMGHLAMSGRGGSIASLAGVTHRPPHLRPHQQHQSRPRRKLGRTRGGQGGGLGSRA